MVAKIQAQNEKEQQEHHTPPTKKIANLCPSRGREQMFDRLHLIRGQFYVICLKKTIITLDNYIEHASNYDTMH